MQIYECYVESWAIPLNIRECFPTVMNSGGRLGPVMVYTALERRDEKETRRDDGTARRDRVERSAADTKIERISLHPIEKHFSFVSTPSLLLFRMESNCGRDMSFRHARIAKPWPWY